jgi:hypothetical protein
MKLGASLKYQESWLSGVRSILTSILIPRLLLKLGLVNLTYLNAPCPTDPDLKGKLGKSMAELKGWWAFPNPKSKKRGRYCLPPTTKIGTMLSIVQGAAR